MLQQYAVHVWVGLIAAQPSRLAAAAAVLGVGGGRQLAVVVCL